MSPSPQRTFRPTLSHPGHLARPLIALLALVLLAGASPSTAQAAAPAKELTELHVLTTDGGTVTASYLGTSLRAIGSTHKIAAKPEPGYMLQRWVGRHGLTVSYQRTLVHTISADPYQNVFSAIFIPSIYPKQAGTYSGLISQQQEDYPLIACGYATLTITSKGSASVKVSYKGSNYRFSTLLDGQSSLQREFTLRGGHLLNIQINLLDSSSISLDGEIDASISLLRSFYSAKNPMANKDIGRFNLTDSAAQAELDPEIYQPALITLDVKPTGQVNYIACSAWGEKITGSTPWREDDTLRLYSYKGGKTPRLLAAHIWADEEENLLHAEMDTCTVKTSPAIHTPSHLSGSRYTPTTLQKLGAQLGEVEVTYQRPADLSQGSQTWSLSPKGKLTPQSPPAKSPRPRLTFHAPTGLWTGTLPVPDLGPLTYLALSSAHDQAHGLWTAPAHKLTPVTPLNTLTAPLHLQLSPLPVE